MQLWRRTIDNVRSEGATIACYKVYAVLQKLVATERSTDTLDYSFVECRMDDDKSFKVNFLVYFSFVIKNIVRLQVRIINFLYLYPLHVREDKMSDVQDTTEASSRVFVGAPKLSAQNKGVSYIYI